MKRLKPIHYTAILALLFVITYTITVGVLYPNTLRMMEANCWIDDYVLQFFRWPFVGAFIMSLPMCAAIAVVAYILTLCRLSRFMPLSVIVALALAYIYPPDAEYHWDGDTRLFDNSMKTDEQIYTYQRLADERQWDGLTRQIRKDGNANTTLGIKYLLLAESASGTLCDNLFSYPIKETEDLLFRGFRSTVSCTFNRQFYDNIGIWDECYHQAQEYSMCLEDFCLQSIRQMIDYSIKEHEWQVAEKLLTVLDEALFEGEFVSSRQALVNEGRKKYPRNDAPLRQDNFVTGYSLQNEMAHNFQYHIGDSVKIQEYIICCMLIRKKVGQACKSISFLPRYAGKAMEELPLPLRQAIEILQTQGQALRDEPSGTYAYFLYNTEIPEQESRFDPETIN